MGKKTERKFKYAIVYRGEIPVLGLQLLTQRLARRRKGPGKGRLRIQALPIEHPLMPSPQAAAIMRGWWAKNAVPQPNPPSAFNAIELDWRSQEDFTITFNSRWAIDSPHNDLAIKDWSVGETPQSFGDRLFAKALPHIPFFKQGTKA